MKRYIALFFAALLLFTLAACKKEARGQTATQKSTTQTQATAHPTSASTAPEALAYLRAEELIVNGIADGTTREQLSAKLGEPSEILKAEEANEDTYIYDGARYLFYSDSEWAAPEITAIIITGKAAQTPRGIQVSDTFDDVLQKFPQDKDWQKEPDGCFYGTVEQFGTEYGYVLPEGDYGDPTIIIATESAPFFKIHFQNGVVESMQIFFSRS